MPVQKIKSGRIITVQAPAYVGEKGTIFYDEDTPELRLSDGYTPGGILFTSGGGGTGTYTLVTATTVRLGGVKIGANIIVAADGTISVAPNPTALSALTNDTGYITTASLQWNAITGKPTFATVSTSGSYNDLTNKPVIPTAVSSLTNDTGYITTASLQWNSITGKPTFSTVSTSGNYNDLTNKPVIPTAVSSLTNDTGYITTASLQWDSITGKPAFATVSTSGNYNDLTNKPTIPTTLTDLGIVDGTNGQVLTTDGAGNYSFTTVTTTGSITGPIALDDLTDVDTTTTPPTNGQALIYNASSGTWIPGSVAAGGIVPASTSTLGGIKTGPDFYMDSTSTLYINQNLWYTAERVNQAITEALTYDYGFIVEPLVVLTNDLGGIADPVT